MPVEIDIDHVARLARLELTDEEKARLRDQLGVILENADYVVTQPSKGSYKAFSKICTHQGCPVSAVRDGIIHCNCHGSEYSIKDGSVTNPPASKPLAESKTTVFEDEVYVTG